MVPVLSMQAVHLDSTAGNSGEDLPPRQVTADTAVMLVKA